MNTPSNWLTITFFWMLLATSPLFSYGQSRFQIPYRQDPALSDQVGQPVRSTTWYFPAERFMDSTISTRHIPEERVTKAMRSDPKYKVLAYGDKVIYAYERVVAARIDTFKLKRFSYYLFRFREPVLHNYPLEKEVYRLTWLRSFHRPVVVRLEKKGTKIRLTTKMLSHIPEMPGIRYGTRNGKGRSADTSSAIPFRMNRRRKISEQTYRKFMQLLAEKQALSISPLGLRNGDSIGHDGSTWVLETHRPEGYYFVTRWSPRETEALRVLGDYLLDLSAAKAEKRY